MMTERRPQSKSKAFNPPQRRALRSSRKSPGAGQGHSASGGEPGELHPTQDRHPPLPPSCGITQQGKAKGDTISPRKQGDALEKSLAVNNFSEEHVIGQSVEGRDTVEAEQTDQDKNPVQEDKVQKTTSSNEDEGCKAEEATHMCLVPSPHPSRVHDPEAPGLQPAAQGGEPQAGEEDCLAGLEEGIQLELLTERGEEDSPVETSGEGDRAVGDGPKGVPERKKCVADTSEEEPPLKRRRMGMCGLGLWRARRRTGARREVEESAEEDGESSTEQVKKEKEEEGRREEEKKEGEASELEKEEEEKKEETRNTVKEEEEGEAWPLSAGSNERPLQASHLAPGEGSRPEEGQALEEGGVLGEGGVRREGGVLEEGHDLEEGGGLVLEEGQVLVEGRVLEEGQVLEEGGVLEEGVLEEDQVLVEGRVQEEGGVLEEGVLEEGQVLEEGGVLEEGVLEEDQVLVEGRVQEEGGVLEEGVLEEDQVLVEGRVLEKGVLEEGQVLEEGRVQEEGGVLEEGQVLVEGGVLEEGQVLVEGGVLEEGQVLVEGRVLEEGVLEEGQVLEEGRVQEEGGVLEEGQVLVEGGVLEEVDEPPLDEVLAEMMEELEERGREEEERERECIWIETEDGLANKTSYSLEAGKEARAGVEADPKAFSLALTVTDRQPLQGEEGEAEEGGRDGDCLEDATQLVCGLITELSSLNRMVMATHRELESIRRGNRTSRPFPSRRGFSPGHRHSEI